VWHLFRVLSAKEIQALRTRIFRYLKEHGLTAVVSIELTRGANGKPNNTVHFHFLTDDPRSEAEIRALFNRACEQQGLVRGEDFRIDYRELWDGYRYFNYFTKCGEKYFHKVILFESGLLKSGKTLQKFYKIGNWFMKSKGKIWDEIKAYMQEKHSTDIEATGNSDDIDALNPNDELPSMPKQSDDVPTEGGMTIEADRAYLREKYGINLDEVLEDDESVCEFDVPGIGRFRKHAGIGWYRIEEELPREQIAPDGIVADHFLSNAKRSCVPDFTEVQDIGIDYALPQRVLDRRKDWQRFKFSVAFRE